MAGSLEEKDHVILVKEGTPRPVSYASHLIRGDVGVGGRVQASCHSPITLRAKLRLITTPNHVSLAGHLCAEYNLHHCAWKY